jgi:vWA-MoxR associated protein C-terminal domain
MGNVLLEYRLATSAIFNSMVGELYALLLKLALRGSLACKMEIRLSADGQQKYKSAIRERKNGVRITYSTFAELPGWYYERVSRFFNRSPNRWYTEQDAREICKVLGIDFDLSDYEKKTGAAPPPPSASGKPELSEQIEPPSPAPDPEPNPSATILTVAFLKVLPMHYEIRAYEWRESAFVELAESLCREVKTIQLDAATQEWERIAQAIVTWVEKATAAKRGKAKYPLVELLLPRHLLFKLIEANFLEQLCDWPDEDEFIACRFVACCPVVVRPLDRYVRQDWQSKAEFLFGKYKQLLEGKGRWVHDKEAAHVDGAFNKRNNESYAALRLVDDLPADSSEEWLKKLFSSNIPLALWWNAAGAHTSNEREEHFRQYKKDNCHLLVPGDTNSVAIRSAEDLEALPRLRMELSTDPLASSMVLFSDNPHRVPDLPRRTASGAVPASSSNRSV